MKISSIFNTDLRQLIKKTFFFFLIVIVIDISFGFCAKKVFSMNNKKGPDEKINTILKDKFDVYIMGSSAAAHGYIPEIISKELGMSVYNAGTSTAGILYHYANLQFILEHHTPKIIIWDISEADYLYDEKYAHFNSLLPYIDINENVKRMIRQFSPSSMLQSYSSLATYNNHYASIIKEMTHFGVRSGCTDGYNPLIGTFELSKIEDWESYYTKEKELFDSLKKDNAKNRLVKEYFDRFILECAENGIELFAFISPRAPVDKDFAMVPIIDDQIFAKLKYYNVPTKVTLSGEAECLQDFMLYKDISHLNHNGATVYSKIVCDFINENN